MKMKKEKIVRIREFQRKREMLKAVAKALVSSAGTACAVALAF